jgi:hypothetical protein
MSFVIVAENALAEALQNNHPRPDPFAQDIRQDDCLLVLLIVIHNTGSVNPTAPKTGIASESHTLSTTDVDPQPSADDHASYSRYSEAAIFFVKTQLHSRRRCRSGHCNSDRSGSFRPKQRCRVSS